MKSEHLCMLNQNTNGHFVLPQMLLILKTYLTSLYATHFNIHNIGHYEMFSSAIILSHSLSLTSWFYFI
jgi:hypothetical protein